MKRSRLKKQSKQPISLIQRKIWDEVKRIVRKRDGPTCYTCGKTGLTGSNWHAGHLFPKASLGAYLKYDLRVIHSQCYHCNINLGGNGAVYYAKKLKEFGPEYMEKLEEDKRVLVKAYDHYVKVLEDYKQM